MEKNFSVILLAAGVSSRFWPLREKYSFPFFGKTILTWQIETIKKLHPEKIVIVANKGNEFMVKSAVSGEANVYIVLQEGEGQAAALLAAEKVVSGPAMILNTSDIYDLELLRGVIKKWKDEGCIIVTVKEFSSYFPGGYIKLKSDQSIQEIVEKPGAGKEPSKLIRLVAEIVPSLQHLVRNFDQRDDPKIGEVALLNKAFKNRERGVIYLTNDFWTPIKYPWHILDVMNYFLGSVKNFRGKNIEIKSNVIIEGPVYIEDNVRIFENTKIVGPCFIGRDTIIGNNNIIRHSHIGAGCVTGFNTDITRSYAGDACWFHSNFIGDSILERNVSLGSGTVIANLRLDEGNIWSAIKGERTNSGKNKLGAVIAQDVRIGVNASIMPGIKIGRSSMIGAGIVVDVDVPDESFCTDVHSCTHNKLVGKLPDRESFKKSL